MTAGYKTIVLCTARPNDAFINEFIRELNIQAVRIDCRLLVFSTASDLYWNYDAEKGEASVFDLIDYSAADALVIYAEQIKNVNIINGIIEKAHNAGVPVITVGQRYDGCAYVDFDYENGFESVVRHVVEHHSPKKLHFVAGIKGNALSDSRIGVFKKVLAENGIPYDDSMLSYGDFWSEPAERAAENLIASGNIPDAVICANDTMAMAVCNVFKRHGYKIPDDLIVTGFDGINEAQIVSPKITSCRCGQSAVAEKIADLITGAAPFDEPQYAVPEFLVSESCGCSPISLNDAAVYLNDMHNMFYRYQDETRTLSEISSKVQNSADITQVAELMNKDALIYNTCCILKKECIDPSADPLASNGHLTFDSGKFLLFNTDSETPYVPREIPADVLVPDIDEIFERKIPVIIMAVNYLEIPLGYVCFYFNNYDMANYVRIPQLVSMLSNALGGYRNIHYQHYLSARIEQMYRIDPLTGLLNRNGLLREYAQLSAKAQESGGALTLILTDLDGLKYINDNFGHNEGDNAIRTSAEALRASCPERAVCARLGGDELVAVYAGEFPSENVIKAQSDYLERYNAGSGKPYRVCSSIGIYTARGGEDLELEVLLKKADRLMYVDKNNRRGTVPAGR